MKKAISLMAVMALMAFLGADSWAQDCSKPLTQADLNLCAKAQYESLDKDLNDVYQLVLKSLDQPGRDRLKKAELAWISYRDLHCDAETERYKDGSGFGLWKYACLSSMSQQRIQDLQSFYDSLKNSDAQNPGGPAIVIERYPANISTVNIANDLLRLNPHYKERAASCYETDNLGKAADQLFVYCNLEVEKRPLAFEILRAFIYDWVDYYVRNNGPRDNKKFVHIIKKMDERFEKLLSTEQFKSNKEWRKLGRDKNDLAFLMEEE